MMCHVVVMMYSHLGTTHEQSFNVRNAYLKRIFVLTSYLFLIITNNINLGGDAKFRRQMGLVFASCYSNGICSYRPIRAY